MHALEFFPLLFCGTVFGASQIHGAGMTRRRDVSGSSCHDDGGDDGNDDVQAISGAGGVA